MSGLPVVHNTAAGTDHFAAVSTNAFSFTSASLRLAVLLFFFFFFSQSLLPTDISAEEFWKAERFYFPS